MDFNNGKISISSIVDASSIITLLYLSTAREHAASIVITSHFPLILPCNEFTDADVYATTKSVASHIVAISVLLPLPAIPSVASASCNNCATR